MTDIANPPVRNVAWRQTHRIIRSIFPPISLFEDIADPADWEALASAESKTNPRLREEYGRLDLVPPDRRVGGPGASLLMAPFVHVSTDRPGRFTDGTYGVYSAGDHLDVAVREVAHHHAKMMRATNQDPGWTSQFRHLIGQNFTARLHDVALVQAVLDPISYVASQALALRLRQAGSNGLVYPSVRSKGGMCIGLFWPNCHPIPVQGTHFDFHFDGHVVDRIRDCTDGTLWGL